MIARRLAAVLLAAVLPVGAYAAEGRWGTAEQCDLRSEPGTFVAPHDAPYELRNGWLSKGFMSCLLTPPIASNAPATAIAGRYTARCGEDGFDRIYWLELAGGADDLTLVWRDVERLGAPPFVVGPLDKCGTREKADG